jgi:hypothetical protein
LINVNYYSLSGGILIVADHPSKDEYVEIVKLIFEQASGTGKGQEFASVLFQAEANMIAYAQSLILSLAFVEVGRAPVAIF